LREQLAQAPPDLMRDLSAEADAVCLVGAVLAELMSRLARGPLVCW
jgi:hypothetical protein